MRGEVIVIRYATDSVVGFENVRTARAFLDELRERLAKFRTHSAPAQDALDRVRSLCGGTAAHAGPGQTGDVRLPGVHALL